MPTWSHRLFIALTAGLLVVACGSQEAEPEAPSGESSTTQAADDGADTTITGSDADTEEPTDSNGDGSSGIQDGSDVDWATVDLTTIDWQNIDLRTIDFEAIRGNPTAANLSEDVQSTIAERLNPGSLTLTIGDRTWEFDEFLCAVGLDSTQSDVYSLSTNTLGEIDGTRVQIQADIRDDSGEGRLEGEGLVHAVRIDDIDDFDNPAVGWEMVAEEGVVIDGYELSAEGLFDDILTPDDDALPGSLVGTCGDMSRISG